MLLQTLPYTGYDHALDSEHVFKLDEMTSNYMMRRDIVVCSYAESDLNGGFHDRSQNCTKEWERE